MPLPWLLKIIEEIDGFELLKEQDSLLRCLRDVWWAWRGVDFSEGDTEMNWCRFVATPPTAPYPAPAPVPAPVPSPCPCPHAPAPIPNSIPQRIPLDHIPLPKPAPVTPPTP